MNTGVQGMFSIMVILLSIWFVWMLLSEVKWEQFLKRPLSPKARLLQIVLAIILGSAFGQFILDYWGYSIMLRYFVQ